MIKVINTKIHSAAQNMQIDQELLENLHEPTLHLYDWKEKSVTYGCFVDPKKFFHMQALENHNIEIAKRPTGGGIVFHMWDLAFSFLLPSDHELYPPNVLDSYEFVHQIVRRAIEEFFEKRKEPTKNPLGFVYQEEPSDYERFCMAHPSKYDLILNGRKVAGAAQRRTKRGFLHQGSIFLLSPEKELLLDLLVDGEEIYNAMGANSFPIGGGDGGLDKSRIALESLLTSQFKKIFIS